MSLNTYAGPRLSILEETEEHGRLRYGEEDSEVVRQYCQAGRGCPECERQPARGLERAGEAPQRTRAKEHQKHVCAGFVRVPDKDGADSGEDRRIQGTPPRHELPRQMAVRHGSL